MDCSSNNKMGLFARWGEDSQNDESGFLDSWLGAGTICVLFFFVAEKGEPRAEIQQHFGFLVDTLPPAEETGRSTSCLTRYLPYRKTVRIKPGF